MSQHAFRLLFPGVNFDEQYFRKAKTAKRLRNLPRRKALLIQFNQWLQRLSRAEVDEGLLQFFKGNDGGDHLPALPCPVTPDFICFGAVWKELHFFLFCLLFLIYQNSGLPYFFSQRPGVVKALLLEGNRLHPAVDSPSWRDHSSAVLNPIGSGLFRNYGLI
jgi:hypothetical protein